MKELGLTEHKLRFTSSVTLETTIPYHMFIEKLQSQLKRQVVLDIFCPPLKTIRGYVKHSLAYLSGTSLALF